MREYEGNGGTYFFVRGILQNEDFKNEWHEGGGIPHLSWKH